MEQTSVARLNPNPFIGNRKSSLLLRRRQWLRKLNEFRTLSGAEALAKLDEMREIARSRA